LAHRAEVHAFVEGAAIGGAVAEEAQDRLVTALHLDREASPAGDGEAATEGATFAQHSKFGIDHAHNTALAAIGSALTAGEVAENLFKRDATRDPVGHAAVRIEHVVVAPQGRDGGTLEGLLADTRMHEPTDLSGLDKLGNPFFQAPAQDHI